jgi:hypothetical protein
LLKKQACRNKTNKVGLCLTDVRMEMFLAARTAGQETRMGIWQIWVKEGRAGTGLAGTLRADRRQGTPGTFRKVFRRCSQETEPETRKMPSMAGINTGVRMHLMSVCVRGIWRRLTRLPKGSRDGTKFRQRCSGGPKKRVGTGCRQAAGCKCTRRSTVGFRGWRPLFFFLS